MNFSTSPVNHERKHTLITWISSRQQLKRFSLPRNAGVEAFSLERSTDGGCITCFKLGSVTVNVGAGSPKLDEQNKKSSRQGEFRIQTQPIGSHGLVLTLCKSHFATDWIDHVPPILRPIPSPCTLHCWNRASAKISWLNLFSFSKTLVSCLSIPWAPKRMIPPIIVAPCSRAKCDAAFSHSAWH